jgi:hypothetical protein
MTPESGSLEASTSNHSLEDIRDIYLNGGMILGQSIDASAVRCFTRVEVSDGLGTNVGVALIQGDTVLVGAALGNEVALVERPIEELILWLQAVTEMGEDGRPGMSRGGIEVEPGPAGNDGEVRVALAIGCREGDGVSSKDEQAKGRMAICALRWVQTPEQKIMVLLDPAPEREEDVRLEATSAAALATRIARLYESLLGRRLPRMKIDNRIRVAGSSGDGS